MKNKLAVVALASLACTIFNAAESTACAQGTAFTYQGKLNDGANVANGVYDLQFAIYDSANPPGTLIAGPSHKCRQVFLLSNGLFNGLCWNFGATTFNGAV